MKKRLITLFQNWIDRIDEAPEAEVFNFMLCVYSLVSYQFLLNIM